MFENVGGGAFLADRSAGSQVVCINVIAHLLRNLEFIIKRSRTICAMTGLNIQTLAPWEECARRTGEEFVGCQSNVQHDANFLKRTYSPIHLFTHSLKKRAAFTLAEVLITLGIIGIVAAMTLPSVVSKYQEKAWLTAFKKTYSVLTQAYLRASQDYGTANTWCAEKNTDCAKTYFDILSPYLNIGQVWGFERPNIFNKASYRDLDGGVMGPAFAFSTSHYKFALSDGTIIGIGHNNDLYSPLLQVDTNGFRGPNQLGKDFFYLSLIRRDDSPVVGGYSLWWLNYGVYCRTEKVSGWWRGGGCSLWVIATGNMDYLHRDLSLDEWQNAVRNLLLGMGKDSLN